MLRSPVGMVFTAGCLLALAAAQAFALRLPGYLPWEWNLALGALCVAAAVVLCVTAIVVAVRRKSRVLFVLSLSLYWILAFAGLLILAFAEDPIPFLSTMVAAILSVIVAWLVQTYLPLEERPAPPRSSGWWTVRKIRR